MDLSCFAADGVLRLPQLLNTVQVEALRQLEASGPGARLDAHDIADLIGSATEAAQALTGECVQPVRAVLFDKTAAANWAVAWHQDRTVVVRERREIEGFGPWSRKDGQLHVAPPMWVLERMVTLRIHLDPCGPDNAPLKVALGSHRLGYVAAVDAAERARNLRELVCLANTGDVWAYSTPILHASERSRRPSRRRVLQVDFAGFDLPGGLQWAGLAIAS